jgi:hypothetical protein
VRRASRLIAQAFLPAVATVIILSSSGIAAPPERAEAVDFFKARQAGDLDAKFIAANEKRGHLLLENEGERPLVIRMPEAFAGVPVLAQFAPFPGPNPGPVPGQGVGIPGNVNQRGPFLQGNWNVPPERLVELQPAQKRTFRIESVCFDHGKPTPNARMKYDIVPLADYKSDKRLAELIRVFGEGRYSQPAVQAIAWHYASGKTIDELRKICHPKTHQIFFTKSQIDEARKLHRDVKERLDSPSLSQSVSRR